MPGTTAGDGGVEGSRNLDLPPTAVTQTSFQILRMAYMESLLHHWNPTWREMKERAEPVLVGRGRNVKQEIEYFNMFPGKRDPPETMCKNLNGKKKNVD